MELGLLAVSVVCGLPVAVEFLPDKDDDELEQAYLAMLESPLDVNRASVDDLLVIPWLEPRLAYRIVSYRDSIGGFRHLGGLRDVPGVSAELYRELCRVVTVGGARKWGAAFSGRSSTDSAPALEGRTRTSGRVEVRSGGWALRSCIEQDRGERSLADWLGIGLGYSGSRLALVAGDFYAGTGLGLVLSGPQRRGAAAVGREAGAEPLLRLAGTSLENRGLRGAGFDWRGNAWQVAGFGALSPRDAELDTLGNVRRLFSSGVHDDSASLARRHRLSEASAGAVVSRSFSQFTLSFAGAGVMYSRAFAPGDSAGSFAGQALGNCGLALDWLAGDYRVAAELGAGSNARLAGGVELAGDWRGLGVRCAVRGTDQNYFAPLSSSRSLTSRKAKAEASARIGYRVAGLQLGLSGRTYRDFQEDSLPARVDARVGYGNGTVEVAVGIGQSYRLERERSRTARLEFSGRLAPAAELAVVLADESPESDTANGRALALLARYEPGRLACAVTGARFLVRGSGVSMNLREYGAVRSGLDFSTSRSSWYGSAAVAWRPARGTGIGLRVARVQGSESYWQAGGQFEFGIN